MGYIRNLGAKIDGKQQGMTTLAGVGRFTGSSSSSVIMHCRILQFTGTFFKIVFGV